MAQLYLAGVLDVSGRITADHLRVPIRDGEREGSPAITIIQHDVREVQSAKGAIHTGIQVLLDAKHRSQEAIEDVIIAGVFGTYIDMASAVTIGMLPPVPKDRFQPVGNAAVSWLFLLVTVVTFFLLFYQVKKEEAYCCVKFGDAYRDYMNKTPRWIGIPKSGSNRQA